MEKLAQFNKETIPKDFLKNLKDMQDFFKNKEIRILSKKSR